MKIACIQPRFHKWRKESYDLTEKLIDKLLNEYSHVEIITLPERWVPFHRVFTDNLQKERGGDYKFIQGLAEKYGIKIISGAIWEKRNDSENYVTCYFFNEKGKEVGRQDKIHLYSYEKENFIPGKQLKLFKIKDYHFSILICFDMAFFETPRLATEHGADFLVSPTQIREEGMHNWKIYLKARALENRIPVIACNTYGRIFKRKFIGNSQIISFEENFYSPSKLKRIQGPMNESGFVFDDINLNFPQKLRKIRLNERIKKENIEIVKE
ncbi:MAG: Formamidase [Promethearchaeota archaeon]|nr:MAG: Formamidase [Candidatus Lokiarchaeota archaeon]